VLEIGVGMGLDYLEWLKAGANAVGVDISSQSLERARRRCELAGYEPDLRIADAAHLPFGDERFDVVYSYGVMHHNPDTPRCVDEAFRVLKPDGQLRIMLYHHRLLTGMMLWLRYGIFRGKPRRHAVCERLENPGTKTYTEAEVRAMLSQSGGLHDWACRTRLSHCEVHTNGAKRKATMDVTKWFDLPKNPPRFSRLFRNRIPRRAVHDQLLAMRTQPLRAMGP
jgi:SAM-dependent methyltransferase